jgi:catechol 2,3-dioxygenase-like lactoylglutathione lyase family enzyme
MIRWLALGALFPAILAAAPPPAGKRPAITGVSHLAVYSTDAAKTRDFYTRVLGARAGSDPENPAGTRYYLSPRQFVEVLPAPANHGASMLAHVAYATPDAAGLRNWLVRDGMTGVSSVQRSAGGDRWFTTHDPEGNEVQFVQSGSADAAGVPGAIRSAGASFMSAMRCTTAPKKMASTVGCSAFGRTGMARSIPARSTGCPSKRPTGTTGSST